MHIHHTESAEKRKANERINISQILCVCFFVYYVMADAHETAFIQVKNSKYMENDEQKKESKNNVTD